MSQEIVLCYFVLCHRLTNCVYCISAKHMYKLTALFASTENLFDLQMQLKME